MTKVLLTGATGFAGSCIVSQIIKNTDWNIVSLHRHISSQPVRDLVYKAERNRISHLYVDFRYPLTDDDLTFIGEVDFIIHCGAEVHALRSVENPAPFVMNNVVGTFNILEAARKLCPKRFIYISSAEVLGGAPAMIYLQEGHAPRPSNPYAASKLGGEALVYSYNRCYALPTITVRTMNLFGEMQAGGKFVPVTTAKLLRGEEIAIHVNAAGMPGVRQWIHGDVFADAVLFLAHRGAAGEMYHVAGAERDNLTVALTIGRALGTAVKNRKELITATHEWRYGIDDQKIRNLGWRALGTFEADLEHTVLWTKEHREWLV